MVQFFRNMTEFQLSAWAWAISMLAFWAFIAYLMVVS